MADVWFTVPLIVVFCGVGFLTKKTLGLGGLLFVVGFTIVGTAAAVLFAVVFC